VIGLLTELPTLYSLFYLGFRILNDVLPLLVFPEL